MTTNTIPEGFVEVTHETGIKHIVYENTNHPLDIPEGYIEVALANGDFLVVSEEWEPEEPIAIPFS